MMHAARSSVVVATGFGPSCSTALDQFEPDVVHVHNLFPNFGTRWLEAWRSKLVVTLHNYRSLCANGLLLRAGQPCRDCMHRQLSSVLHGCYRGSRLATLPIAIGQMANVAAPIGLARRVISLAPRSMTEFSRWGVVDERWRVVPNFVTDIPREPRGHERHGWVYVGRLTREKGLAELLMNWPTDEPLDVYGDGPERSYLEGLASRHVRFKGAESRAILRTELPNYRGLVFSSACFEGAVPQVVMEALCAGLPLLTTSENTAADEALGGDVGAVLPSPYSVDDVGEALRKLRAEDDIHARARQRYEQLYTEEAWIRGISSLYAEVVAVSPTGRSSHGVRAATSGQLSDE